MSAHEPWDEDTKERLTVEQVQCRHCQRVLSSGGYAIRINRRFLLANSEPTSCRGCRRSLVLPRIYENFLAVDRAIVALCSNGIRDVPLIPETEVNLTLRPSKVRPAPASK